MTLAAKKQLFTQAEYLRLEAAALDRHEYHAGEILAMSGGTYQHSRINTNFISELSQRLKGGPCFALESNMRLRIARADKYVYPDCMVVCGEPVFDPLDVNLTTITNPSVIVEVLSDSTEAYDRGEKFTAYRDLPSVKEYVLVSQHRPMAETFFRQDDGIWRFSAFQGLDAITMLPSVQIGIPLSDVYAGLTFLPAAVPPAE